MWTCPSPIFVSSQRCLAWGQDVTTTLACTIGRSHTSNLRNSSSPTPVLEHHRLLVFHESHCWHLHADLAPEVVLRTPKGLGVDWWTLCIFIYELLMSFQPFFDELAKVCHDGDRVERTSADHKGEKQRCKRLSSPHNRHNLLYERSHQCHALAAHPMGVVLRWAAVGALCRRVKCMSHIPHS